MQIVRMVFCPRHSCEGFAYLLGRLLKLKQAMAGGGNALVLLQIEGGVVSPLFTALTASCSAASCVSAQG